MGESPGNQSFNTDGSDDKDNKRPYWLTSEMAEKMGNRRDILRTTLGESLIYLAFIILLTTYVLGTHKLQRVYMSRSLKHQFIDQPITTLLGSDMPFQELKMEIDFWYYVINNFIPSIFWASTYTTLDVIDFDPNQMKIFYESQVLGVPRIRQVRVKKQPCEGEGYFHTLIKDCYGDFSEANEDKSTFGVGTFPAWVYSSESETMNTNYEGKLVAYGGGGYYMDFTRDKNSTFERILFLKRNKWITRQTRAVIIDFSLYNPNWNLFATCRIGFEFAIAGGIIASYQIHSTSVIRFESLYDYFILVVEILVYMFIFYYVFEETRECLYFKLKYFQKFWSYADLTIISTALFSMYLSFQQMISMAPALQRISENPDEYANLESLVMRQLVLDNILALNLLFAFLKTFKFLNFNTTMGQLNSTLKQCSFQLFGFFCLFLIVFVAFAELGFLLFGYQVKNFSTVNRSMFTLLRMMLGDFNYDEIRQASKFLAPIYFVLYIFFVFFVLLNMFLAIVNITYADVKTVLASSSEMQMKDYVNEKVRAFLISLGCKFKDKGDTEIAEVTTVQKIREILKKCNFSDIEIEMFFARYNVDPYAVVRDIDAATLTAELNSVLKGDREKKFTECVKLDVFLIQQERLEQAEEIVRKVADQVELLLFKLDMLERDYRRK